MNTNRKTKLGHKNTIKCAETVRQTQNGNKIALWCAQVERFCLGKLLLFICQAEPPMPSPSFSVAHIYSCNRFIYVLAFIVGWALFLSVSEWLQVGFCFCAFLINVWLEKFSVGKFQNFSWFIFIHLFVIFFVSFLHLEILLNLFYNYLRILRKVH